MAGSKVKHCSGLDITALKRQYREQFRGHRKRDCKLPKSTVKITTKSQYNQREVKKTEDCMTPDSVTLFCWLISRSLHQGCLSVKLALPFLSQLVVFLC